MNRRFIVVAGICLLCVSCKAVLGPDASTSPIALFDQVWRDVDQHYALFAVKKINWDSLGAVYRVEALNSQSGNGIALVITRMLGELHDDHVVFQGNRVGGSYDDHSSPTLTFGQYVFRGGSLPGGVSYGFVSPSIGYLDVEGFDESEALASVDSALSAMKDVRAMLVDVRTNAGGFLENATAAAGRFAARTTTAAYVRYRNGPAHTDFTPRIAQQVIPMGSHRFTGEVYLLTSRNTVSAAELFVLCMRSLGHTTVVGDTTTGETGSPFSRELQNGWSYQIPESIELTLDGKWFEGIGLPPDETVVNTDDEVYGKGMDAQMERAIRLARRHNP